MNYEYVDDLLYQESVKYNGYTSRSIRERSESGNDYYGQIIEDRRKLKIKLTEQDDWYKAMIKRTDLLPQAKKDLESQQAVLNERIKIIEFFGYNGIDYHLDDQKRTKYYYLYSLHDELNTRFTNMYFNYRIGYNTAEQFQRKLQALFDNIAPIYENRLRIQELYEKQILKNNYSLRSDIDLDENSSSGSTADGYYFNEENDGKRRKSVQNETSVKSTVKNLQLRVKNITTGYIIDYSVLNDYLKEFGILFIRVWGDETEW